MQHTTHDIFAAEKLFSSSAICREVYIYFLTSHEDITVMFGESSRLHVHHNIQIKYIKFIDVDAAL